MADITCPTCREPWDSYHLKFDEVWETDLPESTVKRYADKGCRPFDRELRKALERNGWTFPVGVNSVLCFTRCPSCPKGMATDNDRASYRSVLSDILGDDEDGVQSMLEDFGLN